MQWAMVKKTALVVCCVLYALVAFTQARLATTFGDKKHGIINTAVSSDGTLLATSGNDNNVVIWNIQANSIYRKLSGVDKVTKSLAFSSNGQLLITGGKDSKVYIWNIDRGTILYALAGHNGDVNAVCFNFNSTLAASGGSDKTIKVWDVSKGMIINTLSGHVKEVTSVAFNPSGTKMASTSADGTIKIWSTSTWMPERTIEAHKDWARCVSFSADGLTLASCGDDKLVKVYDASGNEKWALSGHKDRVVELSFSPDSRYLVSGSFDQKFIIWDLLTGKMVFHSPSQGEIVYSVSFNPNGQSVIVSKLFKHDLSVWDVSSLGVKSSISPTPAGVNLVAQGAANVKAQPDISFEPPLLEIKSISFVDANKNNMLDAGEQSAVEISIANSGKGNAQGVKLYITEQNDMKGMEFSQVHDLGAIATGTDRKVRIPIVAAEYLQTDKANFRISITEGRGNNSSPVDFAIQTQKQLVPLVVLHEYAFTPVSTSLISKGSKFKLSLIVQNKGEATARIVKVKFGIPENAFIVSDPEFNISELTPQEYKLLEIEVMTNNRYMRPDVPIEIFVSESTGKYGDRKIASARLDEGAQGNTSSPLLAFGPKTAPAASVSFASVSDVDVNIPTSTKRNANCYALIVGNEDYSSHQMGLGSEVNVEFARNDAKIFKEYVNKTLGVPDENIMLLLDAKAIEFNRSIEKLNLIAKASGGDCELIVYFAGHGLPDEVTKDAYIMPVDVSGNDLKYAIKLSYLYSKLSEHPTKKVTVFLDACFSGGARNSALVAARGVKVRPKEEAIKGNVVVFSASSGDQSSLPYKEKQHGIFTYHLLKKIQETKGDVSLKELSEYVNKEVSLRSIIVNNKEQNPQVITSGEVEGNWVMWKLK
jgi:WD40 repeat protein